jgi:hypothetical protein
MKVAPDKRLREIKVRLTESEHQALIERSSRPSLATWIRETCLAKDVTERSLVIKTDPDLLRQLSGIGNNLNQIARIVNQQTKSTNPIDRVMIVAALASIEQELKRLNDDRQNT